MQLHDYLLAIRLNFRLLTRMIGTRYSFSQYPPCSVQRSQVEFAGDVLLLVTLAPGSKAL
jgi:hypothetical protein